MDRQHSHGMKDKEKKINCHACKYFFITWDKAFPKGCRAMNFKSRNAPSIVAQQSSGMPCQRFAPKERERD